MVVRSNIVDTYASVLNEAQDFINEEIKSKYNAGEISSPYECGSWLDVIQIFDYTLEFWGDNLVFSELRDLLFLIKIYDIPTIPARHALQRICSFILATETLHYWHNGLNRQILYFRLQKYFPLPNKPLNYDYLRYVVNFKIEDNGDD